MIEKNLNELPEVPKGAFEQEQRESDVGILLNFFYLLYKLAKGGGYLFIFLFLIIRRTVDSFFYALSLGVLISVLFLLTVLIFAYFQYLKLLFHIDYERAEFHIKKGVFQKSHLVFKLERIQQVNIKRNWLQRLMGLSSLEIETAGSPEKEVTLKSLSVTTAQELMQVLMHTELKNEETKQYVEEGPDHDKIFLPDPEITKISWQSLIKFGLSENIFRGLLLILIPVNYLFQYFSTQFSEKVAHFENYTRSLSIVNLLLFIFLLLFCSLLFNLFRAIFKYYGFQFYQKENELKLNFGLTNLKSISLRRLRIQLISIHQNMLQKVWSIVNYKIYAFGGAEGKEHNMLIPGLTPVQQDLIDQYIELPDFNQPSQQIRPFKRLFYVHSIIHLAILSFVTMLLCFKYGVFPYIWMVVFFLPVLLIWNYQAYKNYELEVYPQYLVKNSGFWKKKKLILNIHKIQTVSIKQYFWQKRLNIGMIIFATAGGTLSFKIADKQVLEDLQNKYLYQIEAFPQKWM